LGLPLGDEPEYFSLLCLQWFALAKGEERGRGGGRMRSSTGPVSALSMRLLPEEKKREKGGGKV